jgi:hypothetical protein
MPLCFAWRECLSILFLIHATGGMCTFEEFTRYLHLTTTYSMSNLYLFAQQALRSGLLLIFAETAWAQAPVVTGIVPMMNARAAVRSSPVTATFSQPLTAGSAAALKVYSVQRGGLRTLGSSSATVSGNTLRFNPSAYSFRPGETVQYTVTTAAASSSGNLNQPLVGQFIANVGGTGTGTFSNGSTPSVADNPNKIVVGDIDGDGDLDLLTTSTDLSGSVGVGLVSIRLNDGLGLFSGVNNVPVGQSATGIALGDVDGDGDLDILVTDGDANTVNVRLNNGNGVFSGTQSVNVGNAPTDVAIGDLDGDGDLDLVASNGGGATVSVRVNNGNGQFSGTLNVALGGSVVAVALGDADNDGDLDIFGAAFNGTVGIRINAGNGTFSGNQDIIVGNRGTYPACIALGDIDGDGDLDFLASNHYGRNEVSVRLNNGSGVFSGTQEVNIQLSIGDNDSPDSIALGDVDADGDLDLFATRSSNLSRTIALRLNNGSGIFSGSQSVSVNYAPVSVVLGDVDNDGDLDLLAANYRSSSLSTASIRLNGGTGPLSTSSASAAGSLSLFPNPTRASAILSGARPNASVILLDVLGHVLYTGKTDALGSIDLGPLIALSSGIYLVRSGGYATRLVVTHEM